MSRLGYKSSVALPPPYQRTLERQLITTQMLLKICYFHLKSLLDLVTWGPAYLIAWVTCLVSWLLQAAFEHTVRVAGVEEENKALEVEQY